MKEVNLLELFDNRSSTYTLPRCLVSDYMEYLRIHKIPLRDYHKHVNRFVDSTGHAPRTKNYYRNKLRRFIEEEIGLYD